MLMNVGWAVVAGLICCPVISAAACQSLVTSAAPEGCTLLAMAASWEALRVGETRRRGNGLAGRPPTPPSPAEGPQLRLPGCEPGPAQPTAFETQGGILIPYLSSSIKL